MFGIFEDVFLVPSGHLTTYRLLKGQFKKALLFCDVIRILVRVCAGPPNDFQNHAGVALRHTPLHKLR